MDSTSYAGFALFWHEACHHKIGYGEAAGVLPAPDLQIGTELTNESEIIMGTLLLIILILLLIGGLPTWPHSRSWGYGPSGVLTLILVVLLLLMIFQQVPLWGWRYGSPP